MKRKASLTPGEKHAAEKDSTLREPPFKKEVLNPKNIETILFESEIFRVLQKVKNGNFTVRMPADQVGLRGKICDTLNEIIELNENMANELETAGEQVGRKGKLGRAADIHGARGRWKDSVDNLNGLVRDLTGPVMEISNVISSVKRGNFNHYHSMEFEGRPLEGEYLRITKELNALVKYLSAFSKEVTRVAKEIATEGQLGGQAEIKNTAGAWKELADNVNLMATCVTHGVRSVAKIVTSVTKGNLKQKLTHEAKGEIAALTEAINDMIDGLATFADQVSTVAREVGTEGKLGGQANVPGASGSWKNLTENVNQLAANLTSQVRAISEVAGAVTKGDLTRTIGVEAKGEVEAMKDTINQMIANLKVTTLRNQEQDWLKSNLAKFTQMLQGHKELNTVTKRILSELAQVVSAQCGLFYLLEPASRLIDSRLKLIATYAYSKRKNLSNEFAMGEGLVGQCALEKERILLTDVPNDYLMINSGLGEAKPLSILVLPVLFEGQLKGVIELASFETFNKTHQDFLERLTESIGIVVNTIETNSRTESLLAQSQSLAEELKSQQEVLRKTNEELQEKALLLANQKEEVEIKNQEVEVARKSLEEKAAQLTLTSKYKSEFLANMSHELRTPLNSLQILSRELIENHDGNLTLQQIKYAKTIHSCGEDLIQLINDILDLSKIESGYISVDVLTVSVNEITGFVERTFRHVSEAKRLKFTIDVDNELPDFIETDPQRLNQILKNLLSNSFKFTEKGSVSLKIYPTERKWNSRNNTESRGEMAVAFEISDTGIGIPKEKQNIIFEAFQQAEGSTSRKYGGTGLGLSISRGLSDLLGGTIELSSTPGMGSVFTLYLPLSDFSAALHNQAEDQQNSMQAFPAHHSPVAHFSGKKDFPERREYDDDRKAIKPGEKVLMIVEEDSLCVDQMLQMSRKLGLKTITTPNGNEAIDLFYQFNTEAVILNINVQNMSGWKVLDRIKNDLYLRHIPVYVISIEEDRNISLRRGAKSFFLKPLNQQDVKNLFKEISEYLARKTKSLLIVNESKEQIEHMLRLFEGTDLDVKTASTEDEAIKFLGEKAVDCMIVYPSEAGSPEKIVQQLESRKQMNDTSVIVVAPGNSNNAGAHLKNIAKSVVLNNTNHKSVGHLLDKATLFLHRPHAGLPDETRKAIEYYHCSENVLGGKKILIVDDDVRNLFALTTALERFGVNVLNAESGHEAIEILESSSDIDLVLMDIMMPEMDGYETMKHIRTREDHSDIPIIAVTAKAMKGDRKKCIGSGATDYITKPVNLDQLLGVMKVWLK
jgi:signal transduction histidine kinase/CheY-like chemotaxis protein/HAMP domain-containing protein